MAMDLSALIIASVGVFGTLASGLLAQRSALQVKRLELESAERQRAAELDSSTREAARNALRGCFIELNYSLRTYYSELDTYLRMASREPGGRRIEASLEGSRQAVRSALAEAQMIAPASILRASKECGCLLGAAYRVLVSSDRHDDRREELLTEARFLLETVSPKLVQMRDEMRDELGVESPGD
ncbi:hypothetical protein [Streptomyces nigrescens]|uniref:Uncharacterized protein n=1 Tax=Streptomyces nigrescens TaxID=1920 RepID=A0A640T9E7_STRNI|nr:hypothetical protein [Streptomyces libani]WAT95196.1 hypothetical protein STRLI_000885 [Streptomyces libani subsp. libani]GFE20379.1 hypothetical protein Sliba_08320 [Streptomyces libani subsp. libani]GGV86814.1 hypothetical protein GCM10010500_05760 [Streptomyces libani subsp. libani]